MIIYSGLWLILIILVLSSIKQPLSKRTHCKVSIIMAVILKNSFLKNYSK